MYAIFNKSFESEIPGTDGDPIVFELTVSYETSSEEIDHEIDEINLFYPELITYKKGDAEFDKYAQMFESELIDFLDGMDMEDDIRDALEDDYYDRGDAAYEAWRDRD